MPLEAVNGRAGHSRRYLVTGGFGYAGAWISEHLAAMGHRVFVLSRRANAPAAAWPHTLISADVESLSPEALAALLPADLDGIVHAASLNEEFLPEYPRRALLVNGLGTRNLIAALLLVQEERNRQGEQERREERERREKKYPPAAAIGQKTHRETAPLPLLIYCSTIHVYGAASGEISENTPAGPRNDYALTHLVGEEYCRLFMRTRRLPCIIARLGNGYGAPVLPDSDKWHLLLNDLCRTAARDGRIVLRSHPDTPRDFIWLGDVAKGMHHLLQRPDLAGSLFNLCSGKSISIGEVARRTAAVAAKRLGREIAVRFEHAAAAPPAGLRISNAALTAATGLRFEDRLEEEIAKLLAGLGV